MPIGYLVFMSLDTPVYRKTGTDSGKWQVSEAEKAGHARNERASLSAASRDAASVSDFLLACDAWLDQVVEIIRLIIVSNQVRVASTAVVVDDEGPDVIVVDGQERNRLR